MYLSRSEQTVWATANLLVLFSLLALYGRYSEKSVFCCLPPLLSDDETLIGSSVHHIQDGYIFSPLAYPGEARVAGGAVLPEERPRMTPPL